MTRQLPRSLHVLLPALGYLTLTLVVFAPILAHIATAIPGGPVADVDGWQNVWNLWWFHRAASTLQNPFYTTMLYHPHGTGLYLQTLNASNGLLVLPVTALWGPIAAYNVALLAAFTLSGLGAYLLALRVSGHHIAAFVGGAIFAFSPFHLTKAWDGQLEQISLQWIALYALFLLRAAEDGRRRDALLAGLFLALVGYTSWYSFFFFAVYSVLFALIWICAARSWFARRALAMQFVITSGFALLLLAPILLPALAVLGGDRGPPEPLFNPNNPLDLILIHSANLYDFFLPSGLHPWWGASVEQLVRQWHPYIGAWNVALGYTALALALAAFVLPRRHADTNIRRTDSSVAAINQHSGESSRTALQPQPKGVPALVSSWLHAFVFRPESPWPWASIALIALLLALGPLLHVGATRTNIPLPYIALLHLPGADIARRPSHFVVLATLMLAPLAALGLRALLERVARSQHPFVLAAVAVLLVFEYAPPRWPLLRSEPHPYYATLRNTSGALLDLPPPYESAAALEAQIVHERPLLGGYISRQPSYPFVRYTPGVRELWAAQASDETLLGGPAAGLAVLRAYDIRHVVIRTNDVPDEERAGLVAALEMVLRGMPPSYRDTQLEAYRLPAAPARPVAFFGPGWHPEEREGERRWRWMRAEGEIIIMNPGPLTVGRLLLAPQSVIGPRALTITFDGAPLGNWWIEADSAPRELLLLLPPGEHRLVLRAPAESEQGGTRQLSIVLVAARFE
jgi:hypothetical protein